MDKQCEGKTFCVKQVNPHAEELRKREVLFGEPFKYDPNYMGCYLCGRNQTEEGKNENRDDSKN